MASWVTIYLKEPLKNLDFEAVQKGIANADWLTLGEDFDIEEDEVNSFLEKLVWKQESLSIELEEERPIQIQVWNSDKKILAETEELDPPFKVQQHLANVKTIVAIEFGISQHGTMFEVLAFEIAYWLVETNDGLICSPENSWFDHDKHRWDPIK